MFYDDGDGGDVYGVCPENSDTAPNPINMKFNGESAHDETSAARHHETSHAETLHAYLIITRTVTHNTTAKRLDCCIQKKKIYDTDSQRPTEQR